MPVTNKYIRLPDYAGEGRIAEAAAAAGVRRECIDDVVQRFRAGQFNEAEFPDRLAEWKDTPDHHFFAVSGAEQTSEAVAAFGEGRTLKAQADYVKKHGEEKAHETAELFGTTLGGKPGKSPEGFKVKPDDKAVNKDVPASVGTNPWSAGAWNVSKQGAVVKALGLTKAQAIAKAAGSYVGATRPAKKVA